MEGCPFPPYPSVRLRDSHLCAGIHMPMFPLDESGNPPSSSVHKLKKADLMFFGDLTGVFGRFLSSQNKTKQKPQTALPDAILLVYYKTKKAIILSQIHLGQG